MVAVTQFKGGVGATTFALSLGAIWAHNHLSVAVVDLDYVTNCITNWAQVPDHCRKAVSRFLLERRVSDERLKECLFRLPPPSATVEDPDKLYIFPQADEFAESFVSVADDGTMDRSNVQLYEELLSYLRNSFDVVIVDLTKAWGVCSLVASAMADEVIAITDDDRYSLRLSLDTLAKLYHESGDGAEFNLDKWRLVINGWSGLSMKKREIESDLEAGLPSRLGLGYSIIPFSIRGRGWGLTKSTLYDLSESCVQDSLRRLAFQIKEFPSGNDAGKIQAAIRRLSLRVVGS